MSLIELKNATCRSEKYTKGLIELINVINQDVITMVEVGSYQGESTAIFCKNLKNLNKIYAIDPWKNGYAKGDVCSDEYPMEDVERNFDIRTSEYSQVTKLKMTSLEASKNFTNQSLDFVYIDANHTYESCKKDIETWIPKVKTGGFIGGHDYLAACFEGVVRAVDEVIGTADLYFEDTSWLKRIR